MILVQLAHILNIFHMFTLQKKMRKYSKCNNLIVNNNKRDKATTTCRGLLRGLHCTVATLVTARNKAHEIHL